MNGWERERGSGAVELLLIAPVVVAFMLVFVLASRQVSAQLDADAVAHAAARAASLHHEAAAARSAAEQTTDEVLGSYGLACAAHTLTLDLDGLAPGGTVTATVACRTDLDDLGPLADAGGRTITGTSSVPIDTYRGQAP